MPVIELDLSPEVYEQWRRFLGSEPAGRLIEVGLLDDWVAMAFMSHVERYLKKGTPLSKEESKKQELEKEAANARQRLTKPQKRVLTMFNENDNVTRAEVTRLLGVTVEEGETLIANWLAEGFLAPGEPRGEEAAYVLGKVWVTHNLTANRPSLNVPRTPHLMRPIDKLDAED